MADKGKTKGVVTKIVDVITIILAVLFILATIFFVFLSQVSKEVEEQTVPLTDSKVLMLMQSSGKLDVLCDIYSVYDDESYIKMKQSNLVGSAVKDLYFSADSYNGNYSSKPKVTLGDIRFNPDASNLVSEYYTTVVVNYNNTVTSYNLIVDFIDNVLIEVRRIP